MKWSNKKIIRTYLLAMCIVPCLTFICFCIFRGENYSQIFHDNPLDVFMDYFHCMSDFTVCDPYETYKNAYPAFTNMIWEILVHFVPTEYRFSQSSFELRGNQYAIVIYFLFILVCVWLFSLYVKIKLNFDNITESILLFALLFSYPMLFTLERGNIIILSLIFSIFFVFFRNNDNVIIRELAYIFLAFAAGIKIYPALLGLLLVKEKKIKEIIRLMIYGISVFFAPFFVFFDGFNSINYMIEGLFTIVGNDRGCGYQYSFSNMFDIIQTITGVVFPNFIIKVITITIILCLLVSFFTIKEEWKQVLVLVLPMIFLPGFSAAYTLIFLFIPFTLFLNKIYHQEGINMEDKIYMVLFFIIFVPFLSKAIPQFANDIYVLTYGMVAENLALLAMTFLLIREMIKHNKKNNNG